MEVTETGERGKRNSRAETDRQIEGRTYRETERQKKTIRRKYISFIVRLQSSAVFI